MEKRYRLNYGESHENVTIADDEKRVYLHGYQVDLLNEYDQKCKVMKSKLEELGLRLIFVIENYNMGSQKFETKFTTNPADSANGEWKVITEEEFNKYVTED